MATVYRARWTDPVGGSRRVALKLVRARYADDPVILQMLAEEARIASRVRHPNVCEVLELDEVGGVPFIAMELLDGVSASRLCGALAVHEALRCSPGWVARARYIVASACAGLHAAHELRDATGRPMGVVHRDVSLQNLFVTREGDVKLLDFGVAHVPRGRTIEKTRPGVVKGKLGYMAPEQLDGTIGRSVDIWGAGVCLWELLAGRRLFPVRTPAEAAAQIHWRSVPRPSRFNPHVPDALDAIVLRALAREPGARFASAADLARALAALDDDGPRDPSAALGGLVAALLDAAPRRRDPDTSQVVPVVRAAESLLEEAAPPPAPPPSRPVAGPLAVAVCALAGALLGGLVAIASPAPQPSRLGDPPTEVDARPLPLGPTGHALPDAPVAPSGVDVEAPTAEPTVHRELVTVMSLGRWGDVYEDGRYLGRTPLRVWLEPGRHSLRVRPGGRLEGARPLRFRVRLGDPRHFVVDFAESEVDARR